MSQHATLTVERWSEFTLPQQLLMIANELHRGSKLLARGDHEGLRRCYERSLALTDLTIACARHPPLLRELLRWRDLVAELYLTPQLAPQAHLATLRALLHFDRETAAQIPWVLPAQPLPGH
ncbi:MAG TPA: hypothetical protein VF017_11485 [Thermoanaerobaculia bacterium]|nr:hypothetical protein [Thermoanaerobaculia bacterium]